MDYGKLYDEQVADSYDLDELGLLAGVRALAVAQVAHEALPDAPTVLDLGAGTGEGLIALGSRVAGGRLIGIDLSERMLAIARQKVALETHVDDACNAGSYVADGSIDLVLAHFLTSFVDRRQLFQVARRALRTGGVLSVASTTYEALLNMRRAASALLGDGALVDAAAPSPESGDAMADELRECGFSVRAMETFRTPITFQTFDECLTWGLRSGFLTHVVAVLGPDRVNTLRHVPGVFPFQDEYVGVAITAVATPSERS